MSSPPVRGGEGRVCTELDTGGVWCGEVRLSGVVLLLLLLLRGCCCSGGGAEGKRGVVLGLVGWVGFGRGLGVCGARWACGRESVGEGGNEDVLQIGRCFRSRASRGDSRR